MRRGRQRSAGAAARWSSGRGRGGPQRARWGLRAQNRPASAGGAARCYRAARRRRRRRPPAQPRRPRGPAHCTPPGGTPRGLFAARSPGAPPPRFWGALGGGDAPARARTRSARRGFLSGCSCRASLRYAFRTSSAPAPSATCRRARQGSPHPLPAGAIEGARGRHCTQRWKHCTPPPPPFLPY